MAKRRPRNLRTAGFRTICGNVRETVAKGRTKTGPEPAVRRIFEAFMLARIKASAQWVLPLGLLLLAVIAVPFELFEKEGLPRYWSLKKELAEVTEINRNLAKEVRHQSYEVQALRNDPGAIEQVAREELGLVKPGEIIFQFPE